MNLQDQIETARETERAALRLFMDGFEPHGFGATLLVNGTELERRWNEARATMGFPGKAIRVASEGEDVPAHTDDEVRALRLVFECWAPIGSSIYLKSASSELREAYALAASFR